MPALPLVLTTAGRDALINAQNTGVSNVVITEIGLSPTQVALTNATAAIPGEFKRLTGVGGQVVAPETFYISGTDISADTYTVRTVALYLSNGVLLGAYSQAAVLLEKASPAMAVIEASIRLAEPLATEISFTGGGWNNPPASQTVEGIVRLASPAEAASGVNQTRAITPYTLWDAILPVLAGKSPLVHSHDATHIISGIFGEARIPDLGMNRITGLVAALAGKAASVHTHVMADITGLVDALAGKAAAAHTHVMGDVTGLVAALAGKAAAVHTHVMADITGLVAALALKAELAGAAFTGQVSAPVLVINGLGANYRDLQWRAANVLRWDLFADPDAGGGNGGSNLILARYSDAGDYLGPVATFSRASGVAFFNARPQFNGFTPWDNGNFDPNSKANAVHNHTLAALPDQLYATGPTGNADWGNADATRYAFGRLMLGNDPGGPGPAAYYHSFNVHYVTSGNLTQFAFPYTTDAGSPNSGIFYRSRYGGAWAPWQKIWTDVTFNPADKANTVHTHTWAQITDAPSYIREAAGAGFRVFDSANAVRAYVYGTGGNVGFLNTTGSGWLARFHADNAEITAPTLSIGGYTAWHTGNFDKTPATAAQFQANSSSQPLNAPSVWAAAALVASAQAATIAVDLSAGLNFTTTMTGNRTLGAPSNAKAGQSGVIQIIQDGTGNRTLAFDAAWKFEGGTDPELSTAANARDVLVFTVIAPGDVVASLMKDVR